MPPPNRAFVGRVDELGALAQALARTGRSAVTQPQAVIGLGGIGKTQLALAYAYAYLSDYDLIRWLRAEEPATLAADYVALAPALGLDPATPDQAVLLDAVRARLEGRDRYLLVFDNATDPASLGPYLPRIGKGHVLITSRHRHWEGTAEALEVEVLPEADAVALLLGGDAANPLRRAEAEALARKLGYLPLALAQARAFMREHGLNIPAYRRRLESVRPRVMAWRPENAPYSLPVAQVWQASLDQVARDCPVAPTLNQLLAFFAPDAIPRDLLGADPGALPDGLREELDRDKAIAALGRLSLLRVDPNTGTLGVHRLVQAVTLDGLDEATAKARAEQTVRLVNAGLPRPAWEYDHQSIIRMLLAHALSTVSEAERLAVGLDAAGEVLLQVGMYLAARASFIEAEQLYRRAIAALKEPRNGTSWPRSLTQRTR